MRIAQTVAHKRSMEKVWRQANPERVRAYRTKWSRANPDRAAFVRQRENARKRGIDWTLTFEEWRTWWGDDFARRGRRRGQLVMARLRDTGTYSLGNIKKVTCSENLSEGHPSKRRT